MFLFGLLLNLSTSFFSAGLPSLIPRILMTTLRSLLSNYSFVLNGLTRRDGRRHRGDVLTTVFIGRA